MARRAADTSLAPGLLPGLLSAATARLIGERAAATDRFGIAVSGGPDSMALLLLAHAAFPGRIAAATVDHQLRSESAAEAAFVAALCASRGIAHAVLTPDQPITGNLQSAARTARYALLDCWRQDHGIDWLMTAHHADDQAETLIMRLNRSSGITGLAGIRPCNGTILRPLLGIRRQELADVVTAAGIVAVIDPTNYDRHFDRVRVRQWLGATDALDSLAVAASASHLAEAETALDWTARQFAGQKLTTVDDGQRLDTRDLPTELIRRLVVMAMRKLAPDNAPPRGEALDNAIARLCAGERAMLADTIIDPDAADRDIWHFTPAPPRRSAP